MFILSDRRRTLIKYFSLIFRFRNWRAIHQFRFGFILFLVILTITVVWGNNKISPITTPTIAKADNPSLDFDWSKVQLNGMGFVTGLLFHPDNGNLLYARTDVGGVYKWNVTTNQWDNISLNNGNNLPGLSVSSIAVDKQNQNVVYMATGNYLGSDLTRSDGQIWKSDNQGQSWTALNPILPNGKKVRIDGNSSEFRGGGERLAIDPNNANIIYYGSNQDGLIRSTNGGTSWEVVTLPTNGNDGTGIAIVTFDPAQVVNSRSSTLFLAIPGKGTYKSTDGGQNWGLMTGGGTQYPYRAQVLNSVYYQSYTDRSWSVPGGSLWKLTGQTWANISPRAGEPVTGFVVSVANPNIIYAEKVFADAPNNFLYKSTDGGTSWQLLPSQLGQVPSWYGNPSPYANGGGSNWYARSDAFYSSNLIINPNNPNNLLRSNGWAVYETPDVSLATSTWNAKMKNFEEIVVNQVLKAPNSSLYAGVWDMGALGFQSDTQFPASRLSFSGGISHVSSIDYSKQNPNTAYAVGSDQNWSSIKGGIGKTTDGGTTWTVLNKPTNAFNGHIAVSSNNDQNLVWFARVGTGNFSDWAGAVYYSNNGGQTWQNSQGIPTGSGLLQTLYGNAIVSDSVNSNTFYNYQCNPETSWLRKIFKSTNGGQNFQEIFSSYDNNFPCTGKPLLFVNPQVAGELWLGCGSADCGNTSLKYSRDGGVNWQSLNGIDSVTNYTIGAPLPGSTSQTLYAYGKVGGVLGLYASTNALSFPSSPTWIRVDKNASTLASLNSLSADQQVPGKIYAGTSGLGILVSNLIVTQTSSVLTSADIQGLPVICGTAGSALVNTTTTCSFELPTNKTLPTDFKLSIGTGAVNAGGTTAVQACTTNNAVVPASVMCNHVPTGSVPGIIAIKAIAPTAGVNTPTNTAGTIMLNQLPTVVTITNILKDTCTPVSVVMPVTTQIDCSYKLTGDSTNSYSLPGTPIKAQLDGASGTSNDCTIIRNNTANATLLWANIPTTGYTPTSLAGKVMTSLGELSLMI